jgi:hypothetical protein
MVRTKTTLMVLLMVSLLGIAACDDDDDEGGATTGAGEAATTAKDGGERIIIKTRLAPVNASGETTGEVLSGSTIGDSAFCAGGRFGERKEPGSELVTRTFRCSGGTLTITFTSTPPDVEQRSDWEVVKGLADFEGLTGGGRMVGVQKSSDGKAREVFTGAVTR